MSLSLHSETYWPRTRRWIVRNFQILTVSAVKICKNVCKLLQLLTTSPPDPTGASVPRTPWDTAPKSRFLASPVMTKRYKNWKCCRPTAQNALNWAVRNFSWALGQHRPLSNRVTVPLPRHYAQTSSLWNVWKWPLWKLQILGHSFSVVLDVIWT